MFQLTCSHNSSSASSGDNQGRNFADGTCPHEGLKRCYECDVVYGDTRQFQFDVLQAEYLNLGTRGDRPYECAIVDEVDSIWIDDAEKLTILSSLTAGVDLLQPLYHHIWETASALNDAVSLVQIERSYFAYDGEFASGGAEGQFSYTYLDSTFTEEQILEFIRTDADRVKVGIHERRAFVREQLLKFMQSLVSERGVYSTTGSEIEAVLETCYTSTAKLLIPNNLREFVRSQMVNWADSALTALFLEEGKDYVILEDNKAIMPLDPHNGTTMEMSSWSNGLHQFLQLKHALKFTPEALQTAFISINAIMGKYKEGQLLGFSGTLHGTENYFQRAHNVLVIKMPDLHHSCFRSFPQITKQTRKAWMEEVITSVLKETSNGRAVLVIAKSINEAVRLKDAIEKAVRDPLKDGRKISLHVRSDDDDGDKGQDWDRAGQNWKAEPGDVIITTLLGARGMDIKGREIEPYGGLHVIVTFVLPDQRLEAQAFGRTARQGNYGTAQYIIKAPQGTDGDFDDIVARRGRQEAAYLNSRETSILPMSKAKDAAFQAYAATFRSLCQTLGKGAGRVGQFKSIAWRHTFTEADWTLLDACQEYWALGLSSEINSMNVLKFEKEDLRVDGRAVHCLMDLSKDIEKAAAARTEGVVMDEAMENDLPRELRRARNVFQLVGSSFHPTQFAFHLYKQNKNLPLFGTIENAERFFRLAIHLDEDHSAGAYVGLAYLALLGRRRIYVVPTHTKGYKYLAKDHLERALEVLRYEIAALQQLCPSKVNMKLSEGRSRSTAYSIQLYERLQVLTRYAGILLHTRDTVHSSLRPVSITAVHPDSEGPQVVVFQDCQQVESLPESDGNQIASFTIELHGLQWKKDLTARHEVEDCIKAVLVPRGNSVEGAIQTLLLASLYFSGRNAGMLKALLALPLGDTWVEMFLEDSRAYNISVGYDTGRLTQVECYEDLKTLISHLNVSQEIFLQVEADRVLSLLKLLRKKGIDADTIKFHALDLHGRNAILAGLPKSKDHIAQLALCPFSDYYGLTFKRTTDIHRELKQRGLYLVATFGEMGSWRPKSTLMLAVLAVAQLAAASVFLQAGGWGALLLAPVFSSGAMGDLISIVSSYVYRDFSWKSFAISKPLNIALGVGLGVGLDSLFSFGTPTAAGHAGTEHIVNLIVASVAQKNVLEMLTQYGLPGCKLILSELAGLLVSTAYKQVRDDIHSKVQAVVAQLFVQQEEGKDLLARLCAIKRLEFDPSFSHDTLSQFFQVWAESMKKTLDWRWEGMKEVCFKTLAKQGRKYDEGGLVLGSFLSSALLLVSKYLKVEDTAKEACEAIKEELRRQVNIFDARYILTNFCGLSKEEVTDELNIEDQLFPPFSPHILPQSAQGLVSLTNEHIARAKGLLKKFEEDCENSLETAMGAFTTSLSNFITDHMIGIYSGVIFQIAYSKPFSSLQGPEVGVSSAVTVSQSNVGQSFIRILTRGRQEDTTISNEYSTAPFAATEDFGLLQQLLRDQVPLENSKAPLTECLVSPAAKNLTEAILFCCEKRYVARFFSAKSKLPTFWATDAFAAFIYELSEDRQVISRLEVKYPLQKDRKSVEGNNLMYAALSALFSVKDVSVIEEWMREIRSNHASSFLQSIYALVQELLNNNSSEIQEGAYH